MSERKWTTAQWQAISARGGSLLVSAAAGSGKTAVLVERAVQLMADAEHPVDADRLLVVTFSRAAAAEMKQRMGDRLAAMIRENPANLYLQRQQALLSSAQISTVNSFCLDLVRQNFQNLSVSPDFSVIDQNELAILEQDCAGDCVAAFYEQAGREGGEEGALFYELVELLSAGRDDRQLIETILKIFTFGRSHPFFEDWLDARLAMYATELPAERTVWGTSILDHARESLAHCLRLNLCALELIMGEEKMRAAYETAFLSDRQQLEHCAEQAGAGDWDGLVSALGSFSFEKLRPLRGDDPEKERVKALREQVRDTVKELAERYLSATGAQFREDLADLRPKIELLFRMVRDFAERLWAAKLERRKLHFSDLEHLTLELLVERQPDGSCAPTAQALEIARRYDHVLVDEYQDTNEVQDLIFSSLSRGDNLFMVGDVKQSIYSFRQAMPEIFMRKKEVFFPFDTGQYPAKVILDTNFRSREEVTGAVNDIFQAVMSKACGDVDYTGAESLRCGASYRPCDAMSPELLVIETQGDPREPAEIEAAEIAKKIRAMLAEGFCVDEKGERRPATLRDFCILLRSPKNRVDVYLKELARAGVAAVAENAGGFLAAREVSSVVSLLRALDNPLLDIELVAALLSPLFDFSADDIARIRLCGKGKPFFAALRDAEAQGDAQAGAFLALFGRLRAQSAVLPADRLLLQIYDACDALPVFQAMELGGSRQKNLLLLIEYAADYHAMGYKQLGGFVGFLGRLQERDGDLAPASGLGEGTDAVQVMSIHRSKGLEFPIVFLADTAKAFNKVDLRQNTLLHAKYGFACVRRDHRSLKQYPTVPMQAIRLEMQRSILSEEMRILYVAMTRAREKLILTGTVKGDMKKKLLGLAHELVDGKLPSYLVGQAGSYFDWILMALLHHPACDLLDERPEGESGTAPWRFSVCAPGEAGPPAAEGSSADEPSAQAAEAASPQLLSQLRARAAWVYPYREETRLPTKLSVLAVAKGEPSAEYRFRARPGFLTEQRLSPTEQGNAMHKFMQFASYQAARDDLASEIARMDRERYLSAAECAGLRQDRLRAFFVSPLAGRIFASGEVHRELKFMAEIGHDMLGDMLEGIGESKIVLQGVADCVFVEDEELVIVDYKTDRITDPEALRARYRPQLELYRRILSQSLARPVRECVLYSFHLSRALKI